MNSIDPFVNQIIQGDCTVILPSIPTHSVDLILTDPPYLVNYRPRDGRLCANDRKDYWLEPSFRELYRILKADRFCISFYGWPWIDKFMAVWKQCGFRPVSHLVWPKKHCSRRGYTQSFHEVGFLLAKGRPKAPRIPIPDVLPWEYTRNRYHTNEKPVIALNPLIQTFSMPGDIVIDPFAGSGSTAIAAQWNNRRFVVIELLPQHCQTARERLMSNVVHSFSRGKSEQRALQTERRVT